MRDRIFYRLRQFLAALLSRMTEEDRLAKQHMELARESASGAEEIHIQVPAEEFSGWFVKEEAR